ncbi:MAG: hypothetical protein H0W61_17400 [Bacteroidetes bacterium]|nr:hypothetical protein [Bacteroidota bacterium]
MITTNEVKILKQIKDRVSTIEMWDNGIMYIKLEDHVTIELEDSVRQFEFLKKFYDGVNKMCVLVESGEYTDITKEAREFSARPESNTMTLGSAVIVKSLAHRIIINFLINFTRQQAMKMRMFDNKEKAIEWLLKLKG